MYNLFWNFIFEMIGAFVVWAVKGFRGKLSDEMSGPYEWNKKSWRNALISIAVVLMFIALATNFLKTKEKQRDKNRFEITIKK